MIKAMIILSVTVLVLCFAAGIIGGRVSEYMDNGCHSTNCESCKHRDWCSGEWEEDE